MPENLKIVSYFDYCKDCKYQNKPESEDPCNECLTSPVNESSRKPINFKPAHGRFPWNGKKPRKNKEG